MVERICTLFLYTIWYNVDEADNGQLSIDFFIPFCFPFFFFIESWTHVTDLVVKTRALLVLVGDLLVGRRLDPDDVEVVTGVVLLVLGTNGLGKVVELLVLPARGRQLVICGLFF